MIMGKNKVNCGMRFEMDSEDAKNGVNMANAILPENLENFYFETDGCECCDAKETFVTLKRIKQKA
jgi:hypothetical protein